MFTIEVQDSGVQAALQAISNRVGNMRPILQAIGEDIIERTKERFATSTGPDGQRWKSNARSTIEAFISRQRGYGKKGINKKGRDLAMGKRVLIGESHDLARQFHVNASASSVTVGNTMKYAAMQQFGGKKLAFPNLWGDIPARPFLPIKQNGELYPADQTKILDALNDYLAGK